MMVLRITWHQIFHRARGSNYGWLCKKMARQSQNERKRVPRAQRQVPKHREWRQKWTATKASNPSWRSQIQSSSTSVQIRHRVRQYSKICSSMPSSSSCTRRSLRCPRTRNKIKRDSKSWWIKIGRRSSTRCNTSLASWAIKIEKSRLWRRILLPTSIKKSKVR